ncbi:isoprenylcysteine carboxylmethyltransferase family protein [candidate division FCPU426 bacterium]|nr:isoprenylcysteine carboxylmethyltransferase family protein [candidate division FCPU426 bacterium]
MRSTVIAITSIAAGTIFLLWFTWWAFLKGKRYHGLARFFSFESLLLLIVLNAPVWFFNPVRPVQIVSWLLLLTSIILAVHGFYMLRRFGRPRGQMENTTKLITTGLYRFIRHPLYASLVFLGLGAWLKSMSWMATALAATNLVALYATARIEEGEMVGRFGEAYREYMRKTKRFIPFVL